MPGFSRFVCAIAYGGDQVPVYGVTAMSEKVNVVFRGFVNLTNLEKLKIVDAINEYFDSNDKESVRAEHERTFKAVDVTSPAMHCPCCGR